MKCPHCNKDIFFRCRYYYINKQTNKLEPSVRNKDDDCYFPTLQEARKSAVYTTKQNGWADVVRIFLDEKLIEEVKK